MRGKGLSRAIAAVEWLSKTELPGSQGPAENGEREKDEQRGDTDRAEDAAGAEKGEARFGVAAERDDDKRDSQPGQAGW